MPYQRLADDEQRPLISSGQHVARSVAPLPESSRDDEATSSSSCRHCLTSYVPLEPLLLGYTLSRVLIMGMTTYYLFDQASLMYGDPSMDSLNPCGNTHDHHRDKERAQNVQREFVQLAMISVFSDFITAVIPTMFIGPVTDRIGRRIGFVLPLLGTCARAIVFLIVLGTKASFYYIYIGTVLEGLGGGFGTFLMTAFSTAADVTSSGPQRGLRICIVEVVNILGSSAATIAGGQWRKTGYIQPVMCAAAIGVASLIYALFFWPETRNVDTARDTARKTARESARDNARDNARETARETARDIAAVRNYGAVEGSGDLAASRGPEDVMRVSGNVGINHGDLMGASHHGDTAAGNGNSEVDDDDEGDESSFEAGAQNAFQSSGDYAYQSLCQVASGFSYRESWATPGSRGGSGFRGANRNAHRSGEQRVRGRDRPEPASSSSALPYSSERSPSASSQSALGACCSTAVSNAKKSWRVYFGSVDDCGEATSPERRQVLALCFFCFLLTVAVNFSKPSIEESFRMSDLCWNAVKESEFTSAWLVAHWLCILLVLRVLQHWLHVHDVYIAMIGCVSGMAALFVFIFATLPSVSDTAAGVLVFASAGCGSLARALIPMLRSISSSMVNKDEQGALFVSYACVELAGAAVFDMASGQIFKATVHTWSGIIFIIWILFLVVVMILLIKLAAVLRRQQPDSETGTQR